MRWLGVLSSRPHLARLGLRSYGDVVPIKKKRNNKVTVIHTLDPSRLTPSDCIDVSLKTGIYFQAFNCNEGTWLHTRPERRRFPAGTQGFLYYHPPMDSMPPVTGEVRFRLTPGDKPQSFKLGSDYQQPNGLPWRVPLLAMTENVQNYAPLRELLLADELVTSDLMTKCSEMAKANPHSIKSNSIIVHSLSQLFPINFTRASVVILVLTRENIRRITLCDLFSDGRASKRVAPYSGSAICRLERSTLPEHRATRTVVIRIVKITSPVTYTIPNYRGFIPKPIEGELVCHVFKKGPRPWSHNVDKVRDPGWRALYGEEDES